MSDIIKKKQNLSKKSDSSTWIYLLIWVVLSGVIIFLVFWVYTSWDKKQQIKERRRWIHEGRDEEVRDIPKKEEILAYEDVRGSIIKNHELAELLEQRINEASQFKEWLKDLEEIKGKLKVVEDLEKVLEDLEKIKELRIQVNRQSSILDRLWLTVFPNNELLNKQLEAQKEWLKEAKQHEDEAFEPIADFIDHFYKKFRDEGLTEEEKTPWNIHPVKVDGKIVNDNSDYQFTYQETNQIKIDLDYLKSNLNFFRDNHGNKTNRIEEKPPVWKGFTGFFNKDTDNTTEGRNTAGYTDTKTGNSEGKFFLKIYSSNDGKDKFWFIEDRRIIGIKLRIISLFNRQNKYYDRWYTDTEKDNLRSVNIGVENLINTIAHELAHAIIETTRFDYHHDDDTKRLNTKWGGHGTLHDNYTDRIRKMILASSKYKEFVEWWKEPQKNG